MWFPLSILRQREAHNGCKSVFYPLLATADQLIWQRTSRRKGFLFKYVVLLGALFLISLNFLATFVSMRASMENYPGGVALAAFNRRYAGEHRGE